LLLSFAIKKFSRFLKWNKSGQNEKEHNIGCKGKKNFGNSNFFNVDSGPTHIKILDSWLAAENFPTVQKGARTSS
jgi:hypothetical protein